MSTEAVSADASTDAGKLAETSQISADGGGGATGTCVVAVVAVAAAIVLALAFRLPFVNGSPYWQQPYVRASVSPADTLIPVLVASLPAGVGAWGYARRRVGRRGAVLAATVTALLLMLVVGANAPGREPFRLAEPVLDPNVSGYFSAAYDLAVRQRPPVGAGELLASFPRRMAAFPMHPRTKPPGLILLNMAAARWFPNRQAAALAVALATVACACGVVPATYAMLRRISGEADPAVYGAIVLSLCPGFVLNTPQFDQVFPLFTCLLVLLWWSALAGGGGRSATGRAVASAGLGAALFVTTFVTYNVLPVGLVLAAMVLRPPERPVVGRAAAAACIAVGVFLGCYRALYAVTGFDPLATFHAAWLDQRWLLDHALADRRLPGTIPWDLWEFALSLGGIAAVPIAAQMLRRPPGLGLSSRAVLALPLVVAATGLQQAETGRVWLYMVPLTMLPIGRELSRWPRMARGVYLAAGWAVLAAMYHRLGYRA